MRLLALAALTAMTGCATAETENLPPLEVVTISDAAGMQKQAICSRARDWAAVTFKDSKAVVEVYDPVEGKMIGKGRMQVPVGLASFAIDFTLAVECKDGRFRSSFTDYYVQTNTGPFPLRVDDPINKLRTRAEARSKDMAANLATFVTKKSADW
jgi:hypothetical protein